MLWQPNCENDNFWPPKRMKNNLFFLEHLESHYLFQCPWGHFHGIQHPQRRQECWREGEKHSQCVAPPRVFISVVEPEWCVSDQWEEERKLKNRDNRFIFKPFPRPGSHRNKVVPKIHSIGSTLVAERLRVSRRQHRFYLWVTQMRLEDRRCRQLPVTAATGGVTGRTHRAHGWREVLPTVFHVTPRAVSNHVVYVVIQTVGAWAKVRSDFVECQQTAVFF